MKPEVVKSILDNIIAELSVDPSLFVANPGKDFTRDRKLPLSTMLKIIIGMNGGSIKRELYDYDKSVSVTTSAFVQQRDKILPDMFGYIFRQFALVRVCCAFAGITSLPSGFCTANEPTYLDRTGAFTELKGSKYTDQSVYLGRGDILVTKVSGHTVVVLTNGARYESAVEQKEYLFGERTILHGCEGRDVKTMQEYLLALSYDLGKWGADGDALPYADETSANWWHAVWLNGGKAWVSGKYGKVDP